MRLIDADAAINRLKAELTRLSGFSHFSFSLFCNIFKLVKKVFASVPTIDAVPVVRCCQCKHAAIDWPTGKLCCARNGKVVGDEVWGGFAVDENGYCNYGEKRDLEG